MNTCNIYIKKFGIYFGWLFYLAISAILVALQRHGSISQTDATAHVLYIIASGLLGFILALYLLMPLMLKIHASLFILCIAELILGPFIGAMLYVTPIVLIYAYPGGIEKYMNVATYNYMLFFIVLLAIAYCCARIIINMIKAGLTSFPKVHR